jgi:hypothetical protein
MSSKTLPLDPLLAALTTQHFVDDDLGSVTVTIPDALMAVATAINRIADCHEKNLERMARAEVRMEKYMFGDEPSGHA